MMIVLRLLFGGAFAWVAWLAAENARTDPHTGDLANAGYLALAVVLGILNAVLWAPFLGAKLADAMTGSMTGSTYMELPNHLLKFIYWLQGRGFRRSAAFFCFFEGIRHPDRPSAFVLGMKNARPGSWLQKIYAREVFRFDNTQNCIQAYQILQEHGINPRPHRNAQVEIALESLHRETRPEREKLPVPHFEPPPLQRNPNIRIAEPDAKPDDNPPTS